MNDPSRNMQVNHPLMCIRLSESIKEQRACKAQCGPQVGNAWSSCYPSNRLERSRDVIKCDRKGFRRVSIRIVLVRGKSTANLPCWIAGNLHYCCYNTVLTCSLWNNTWMLLTTSFSYCLYTNNQAQCNRLIWLGGVLTYKIKVISKVYSYNYPKSCLNMFHLVGPTIIAKFIRLIAKK